MTFCEVNYREYANHFWDELNNTFGRKRYLGYLPIVFTEPPSEMATKTIYGVTEIHVNQKKQVYSCFPIVFIRSDNTDNQLRQTIRHEVIHYFLALNYYNHDDNSALFALICSLFDGGAYEKLSSKSQLIYDVSKTYLEQAYDLYIRCQDNVSQNSS